LWRGGMRTVGNIMPETAKYGYRYAWKNNPRRAELHGRSCRVVARGSRGTVLTEFENGERVTTSGRALRRLRHDR